MGLKKYRPITPTLRHTVSPDYRELTRGTPIKSLTEPKRRSGGRDNYGHVSQRWISGGHKQRYRLIDFRRDKDGIPARVASIEYDPNRSARIALLNYFDGERRYIVAPDGLRVGELVQSGPDAEVKPGNCLPLRSIPLGTNLHNIELNPGRNARIARSAGSYCQLMAKEGDTHPAPAVRRDPHVPHELPCGDRTGRRPRSREHLDRQGGTESLEGAARRACAASR
jgi:large subunit ribosomal protein L2